MKLLSTVPDHAGSQAGKENAEFIAEDLSTSRSEKLISKNSSGPFSHIPVLHGTGASLHNERIFMSEATPKGESQGRDE